MWVKIIIFKDGEKHKYVKDEHIQKIEQRKVGAPRHFEFVVSIKKDGKEELIEGVDRIEYPTTLFESDSNEKYYNNLSYIEDEIKNLNVTLKKILEKID